MNSSRHFPFSALSVALVFSAADAGATDGRYRDFVIGERAGGMGGAAIAVASDVDAVFYNPAGLAQSRGDSISLSANLYGMQNYAIKGGLEWGGDEKSESFVTIPGAMGGVSRLSDEWVFGFGAFAPKQEKRHLVTADSARRNFSNYDYDDQTLWLGPAIAWSPAGSGISVGAGLYAVYRECKISRSTFSTGEYAMNGAIDLSVLGVLAAAGVQIDLGDGWRAGAVIQSPNVRVWDDGTFSLNASFDRRGADEDAGYYSTDVRADNYIPFQLGVGIGRTVPGKWGFSLDANYHPSANFDFMRWNIDGARVSESIHMHSVLDAGLGGELIVAERYPIRAGVYTAFSSIRVPEDPEDSDFITSDVDMYGVTFSIGRRSENMIVNFGFDVAFGSGHDLAEGYSGKRVRTDCDRRVMLTTVSTTYFF
ncbi:MAG: hypothetical protein IJS46_00420 [Kiritimatiellae bacterium]|nr:hypothetical protein [Kiritimatiellia bacterium]